MVLARGQGAVAVDALVRTIERTSDDGSAAP
jgi:hypothetical protein